MPSMPLALSALADGVYTSQQATARRLADVAQATWVGMPPTSLSEQFAWWEAAVPLLADRIAEAQYENVTTAQRYLDGAALVQGLDPDTARIAPVGFLSATQDVSEWLRAPMLHTASLVLRGAPSRAAQTNGLSTLLRVTTTLAQDAGREATGAGIASHPGLTGYYRRLRTPSCSRCAVLAGAYYKANDGFLRHPRCDCMHVPAAGHYNDGGFDAEDAIRRGQVTGLSEADRAAILDHGADPNQVINAKRNGAVQTTTMFGDRVQHTTEGTTVRGIAGKTLADLQKSGGRYRVAKRIRLTPNEIYRQAGSDPALTRRLLERNGYITG